MNINGKCVVAGNIRRVAEIALGEWDDKEFVSYFPHSRHYIRRVRLGKNSNLVDPMIKAGYFVEEDVMHKQHSLVIEIPVSLSDEIRTLNEVSL